MTRILIVDDNPLDRELAAGFVRELNMEVDFAEDGREGLAAVNRNPPDAVLTDLDMPELNGLELVQELKSQHASIPVILMTAKGSEQIAAQALKFGASNYVPKRLLNRDLKPALETVLDVVYARRQRQEVINYMARTESRFLLGYEAGGVSALVSYFQDGLKMMHLCDERGLVRIGTALIEAIANAMEHGNLELDSTLRDDPNSTAFNDLGNRRKCEKPYSDRRVDITATLTRERATYVIKDEGPGFDISKVPDPTDPENMMKSHGRGILLIRTFMTTATYNESGNVLTLTYDKDSN